MRNRSAFDKEGDLGGVELCLWVDLGMPIDLDCGQMLDGIAHFVIRIIGDSLSVSRNQVRDGPADVELCVSRCAVSYPVP